MGVKPVLLNKVDLESTSTHKSDNMTNIELYINNTLCDINNPESLGVRLNRVLINPSELNTKDAQYSYSITIPSTPQNDGIFGYANIEETKNKFNRFFDSQLYVDSVKIFDGQFKLSEIDTEGNYKGNLVVPAPKTIKEIFGEKKMNEVGEWLIDVNEKNAISGEEKEVSFPQFISNMNLKEEADCIFPLVLYGLLPKQPKIDANGDKIYTGKTLWDDTVRLGVADFPPSINCLKAIQKIFESMKDENDRSVKITGSAFADERLKGLYMSYQNPVDYEQPWNWGQLGCMHLRGTWTNIDNGSDGNFDSGHLERNFNKVEKDSEVSCIAVNLFSCKNAKIEVLEDNSSSIFQHETQKPTYINKNTTVTIPVSGLYKVNLHAEVKINVSPKYGYRSDRSLGIRFMYANENGHSDNYLDNLRYELKLLRSRGDEIDFTSQGIDTVFFKDNFNQANDPNGLYETVGGESFRKYKTYPKYFPRENSVLFVDPYQNNNMVCGFSWGKARNEDKQNPTDKRYVPMYLLAAKSGLSWSADNDTVNYCAVDSPEGYWEYGIKKGYTNIIGDEDDEAKALIYRESSKFKVEVANSDNYIRSKEDEKVSGEANIQAIVWLERGERLALADVLDTGYFNGPAKSDPYAKHEVSFDLQIEPYRTNRDWVKVDLEGTGTGAMNWEDDRKEGLFPKSTIDLIKFLPSEQKVDEWLDNFCKAFNLQLTQPAPYKFELNVKQQKQIASAGSVVDLDGKASIVKRSNQPLDLPSAYQLGFKINKEEEGYIKSYKSSDGSYDDGGGSLNTGSVDGKELTQNSSFSYNWFKRIKHNSTEILLPVITHLEIWQREGTRDYEEMMPKLYTHYAQRFWYRSDMYDAGNVWNNGKENEKPESLLLSMVSNRMRGGRTLLLNYHNKPNTILTTYFNVIVGADSNYTEVECYLTPDEYERLDGSCYAQLNGDLYYIASVEGYDPIGRNSTKLKLIRKV